MNTIETLEIIASLGAISYVYCRFFTHHWVPDELKVAKQLDKIEQAIQTNEVQEKVEQENRAALITQMKDNFKQHDEKHIEALEAFFNRTPGE